MKVLILGSRGMLGQELVREFSASNEVIAYDKDELDITDFFAAEREIVKLKPDVIINAVALNSVDAMEESSEIYDAALRINAEAPGNMAKLCAERGIIFVHYSSDYVFDGADENGYAEDSVTRPCNKYGETKAKGEALVTRAGGKYYIIRLSKLFGKPATTPGAKKSFVETISNRAIESGAATLDVVDEEKSSPTYAPDAARLTRSIIETQKPWGIYHGANSGACTWYEWAKEIFKTKNLTIQANPVPGSIYPRPAPRPSYSPLINTKLPAQRSWQDALRDFLS